MPQKEYPTLENVYICSKCDIYRQTGKLYNLYNLTIGRIKSSCMIKANLSEARDNLSDLVNLVGHDRERVMLERYGKPVAAIVSLEDFERLETTENASNSALLKVKQEKDELMLSLFLDFLMEKALHNPQELESYTQEMADEDDELMAGVVLDL